MIENAKNTMMGDAPKKKHFLFGGDGIYWPKTIIAETIEEAEKLWHEAKTLISKPNASPEAIPAEQKVENKPIDTENV